MKEFEKIFKSFLLFFKKQKNIKQQKGGKSNNPTILGEITPILFLFFLIKKTFHQNMCFESKIFVKKNFE